MTPDEWREFEANCRTYIAVAEACWRDHEPSHSFHVFEWLCWKQRLKYPVVWKQDQIINRDGAGIS